MPAILPHPEEHPAPRVAVAIYANEKQPSPKRQGLVDWERFAPRLLNHDIRTEKSGLAFGPHSLIHGGKRRNSDVEAVSMLVTDSDNGVSFDDLAARFAGFQAAIYTTPSRLPQEVQAAIARCAGQAAAAIGLQTGPIHAELRVNERGPWMLEIAGRSIGGLCGRTLRFDYGGASRSGGADMSLEELIVRQACGLPWRASSPGAGSIARASGVMMIPIPEAGQLREVGGVPEAEAVPGIEGVEISVALHHTVTPLPEGESYLGFIFAGGETPAAVEASLREAHGKLRFTIVPEIELSLGA